MTRGKKIRRFSPLKCLFVISKLVIQCATSLEAPRLRSLMSRVPHVLECGAPSPPPRGRVFEPRSAVGITKVRRLGCFLVLIYSPYPFTVPSVCLEIALKPLR